MHVGCAVVLLLLFTAGCARARPDTPVSEPHSGAKQPAAQQPAAEPAPPPAIQPVAPAPPQPVAEPAAPVAPPPVAKPVAPAPPQPVARPTAPATPQPVVKPAAPAPPQPKPAAAPPPTAVPPTERKAATYAATTPAATTALDLNALKEELKSTSAIGFFTKITLKNQVDDLLDEFRDYYQGKSKLTKTDLRRSYDLLIMKVLSLLQDEDQKLASAIVSSREAIWDLLADPKKFATLPS